MPVLNVKNLFNPGPKDQPVQGTIPPTRSDKIHAFHSILAMLAQIQQEDPLKKEDVMAPQPPSASERKQLKLTNAFAHLAVTKNEVVAATLYTPPEGLAVMTWMQEEDSDGRDKPKPAQSTPEATFWGKMFWVFATNTTDKDHKTDSEYQKECPRIVGATPPPGYPTANANPKTNLREYLREFPKNWMAPKDSSHLWVVTNILTTLSKDESQLSYFMEYMIAASHPKMIKRFETSDSKEYLHCFMSMEPEEICFNAACVQRERLHIELLNDHRLLNILPKLFPDYETKYPNIATNELKNSSHPALIAAYNSESELFNDVTCKEYHLLFKHLLDQYQRALGQVASLAKERKPFNDEAAFAADTGHALLTMVRGRAFHLYLSTAAPILSKYLAEVCQAISDENDDEAEEEPDLNLWVPVKADGTAKAMDAWQPFKSWIMLMVVQLDAADSLCRFVKKVGLGESQIDVKLVYSPFVSRKSIPLEELLQAGHIREPESAPITNAELLDFVKASKMRRKQIETLDGYTKAKWDSKHILDAKRLIQEILTQATEQEDEAAGKEKAVKKDKAAKRDKAAKKHKAAKKDKATKKDKAAEDDKEDSNQGNRGVGLNTKISGLCNNILGLLSRQPRDTVSILPKCQELSMTLRQLPLLKFNESTQSNAKLHCEAGLASVLDKTTRDAIQTRIDKLQAADSMQESDEKLCHSLSNLLKETKKFGRVIGVTKRCCPVCRLFLSYLSLDGTNTGIHGIVTPGFHNTITNCTLPEWTPEVYVDRMNVAFGRILRGLLVNISREVALQKFSDRRQSSGSGVSVGNSDDGVGFLIRDQEISAGH